MSTDKRDIYLKHFNEYVVEELKEQGVDIREKGYKHSPGYKRIKDTRIFTNTEGMTIEEYIERFLLDSQRVEQLYESKYDMGNPCELDGNDYDHLELAYSILYAINPKEDKADDEAAASDLAESFSRSGGLIDRLKKHISFDINAFETGNKRHQREILKILYLFSIMEKGYFSGTNILLLLSKPSMESVDNSFFRRNTRNGIIIKTIKGALEKEMSLEIKQSMKKALYDITIQWDAIIKNVLLKTIELAYQRKKIDFQEFVRAYKDIFRPIKPQNVYRNSPVEILYLKIIQYEHLGQIIDIDKINQHIRTANYTVPYQMMKEIARLSEEVIEDLDTYIDNNASRIANYVYLKPNTTKDERRRIRRCKEKVHKIFDFFLETNQFCSKEDIQKEVLIVSVLQAIILDEKNEVFDYSVLDHQTGRSRKQRIHRVLKKDEKSYDALKHYWVCKAMNRYYANLGLLQIRLGFLFFEKFCNEILCRILDVNDIDEMASMNRYYVRSVMEFLSDCGIWEQ